MLADALSYVQDTYTPHTMIDMATLTGACVVALVSTQQVCSRMTKTSPRSLSVWVLNHSSDVGIFLFSPEYTDEIKSGSDFADLRSIGTGREAGACTAAAFNEFVSKEKSSWAHVDIAGSAMYSKPREFMSKGATGFGSYPAYRLLVEERSR